MLARQTPLGWARKNYDQKTSKSRNPPCLKDLKSKTDNKIKSKTQDLKNLKELQKQTSLGQKIYTC